MKSKRLLFVINTLSKAGAEVALIELIKRLSGDDSYQIDVYVMCNQGELILPEGVNLLNDKFNSTSVLSAEGRKALRKTVLISCFKHFSLIKNLPYLFANLLQMLCKKRVQADKLLWRIISDGSDYFSQEYDLAVAFIEGASTYYVADHIKAKAKAAFVHIDYKLAGYTNKLDKNCYSCFNKIFAVSGEVKDAFVDVYPNYKDKTFVFHNILDTENILAKADEAGGFADDFDGIRILTVGRLVHQKAYDISINAMQILKEAHVTARWYVIGEGDLRQELSRQISSSGLSEDFVLLGAIDNPYPYFAKADIYAHLSRYEGKSIALQEAQILGLAIIASDCSGNREQINNGVDGILVPLEPKSIAEGLIGLIEDESKRNILANNTKNKQINCEDHIKLLTDLI